MLHQKRKPGQNNRLTQEEQVKRTLQTILNEAITHQTPSIRKRIRDAGLQLHQRGRNIYSVSLPSGKRYRLSRLQLLDQLFTVLEAEASIAHRQIELQRHIERVTPSRNYDIDYEEPPM